MNYVAHALVRAVITVLEEGSTLGRYKNLMRRMQFKMLSDTKNPFANHLRDRGLSEDIRCWIDWHTQIVRFPLWTMGNGKLIGYCRYNWRAPKLRSNDSEGRYINKANKAYCMLWGLEHFYDSDVLFVTEGVWDAIRVINAGYACVAALTATPGKAFMAYWRTIVGGRRVIVLGDNDAAGKKLGKLGELVVPPAEDMNAVPQDAANLWLNKLLGNREECLLQQGQSCMGEVGP